MRKKIGLAVALAAALTLAFNTSHATTYSAQYIASGNLPTGVITSPGPSVLTEFPAGKIPTSIKVVDAAGLSGFSVDVCQNVNTSNPNCDAGDNILSYCSTGQTKTITGFSAAFKTIVYVNPDNLTALSPCVAEGNTLAGTITFIAL